MAGNDPTRGMPPWWNRDPTTRSGQFNLWVWGSPRRRWAFLLIALVVAVAILGQLVRNPHGELDHARGLIAVLAAVFIVGLVLHQAVGDLSHRRRRTR